MPPLRSLGLVLRANLWRCWIAIFVWLSFSSVAAFPQNSQRAKTKDAGPATPSAFVRRLNSVVYTRGVHADLLADLYLPAPQSALSPAIVYLHGGAWKSGDRTQLQDVAMSLAGNGYVGMAVDYDLTDRGDRFPVAFRESERAIAWLRNHAQRYGIDPSRIAVAGSSAGGELAALVALDPHPLPNANVQAAIVFNGVLDLSYVGPDAENMVSPYLGGACAAREQLCKQASPVFQVHAHAPPFYVGHGTADRIVPYSQAEDFVELLRSHDIPVTPFIAADAGHTYWKTDRWYQENIDSVLVFLKEAMPDK